MGRGSVVTWGTWKSVIGVGTVETRGERVGRLDVGERCFTISSLRISEVFAFASGVDP